MEYLCVHLAQAILFYLRWIYRFLLAPNAGVWGKTKQKIDISMDADAQVMRCTIFGKPHKASGKLVDLLRPKWLPKISKEVFY